jgi:ADP-L-glycero-D-manno-heptose 6-epimerase
MINGRVHVTGGAGFIGSNLVRFLNSKGVVPVIYDRLHGEKWKNIVGLNFELGKIEDLIKTDNYFYGDTLVHLAANVDTKERFCEMLWENNVRWPQNLFQKFHRVVYASSGATYGAEESNFKERIDGLRPLNPYGFTKWALDNTVFGNGRCPCNTYALRFFNVYGPNEVHKGDMQSVVSKAIHKLGPLYQGSHLIDGEYREVYSLFKSTRPDVKDGEQKRDFVYVGDVCKVIYFFLTSDGVPSGIYNLGSGKARSFLDLMKIVSPNCRISYVELPDSLKESYQYFTEADLTKLRSVGYKDEFTSLEDGVAETMALTFPKSPHKLAS